jgi:hypothetical protein
MHAGFHLMFSSFLPQRFAGSASISCISDIFKDLELLRNRQCRSRFFNSRMTGCVAITTRDLGSTCRES